MLPRRGSPMAAVSLGRVLGGSWPSSRDDGASYSSSWPRGLCPQSSSWLSCFFRHAGWSTTYCVSDVAILQVLNNKDMAVAYARCIVAKRDSKYLENIKPLPRQPHAHTGHHENDAAQSNDALDDVLESPDLPADLSPNNSKIQT